MNLNLEELKQEWEKAKKAIAHDGYEPNPVYFVDGMAENDFTFTKEVVREFLEGENVDEKEILHVLDIVFS